jgi:hypothetical protein
VASVSEMVGHVCLRGEYGDEALSAALRGIVDNPIKFVDERKAIVRLLLARGASPYLLVGADEKAVLQGIIQDQAALAVAPTMLQAVVVDLVTAVTGGASSS